MQTIDQITDAAETLRSEADYAARLRATEAAARAAVASGDDSAYRAAIAEQVALRDRHGRLATRAQRIRGYRAHGVDVTRLGLLDARRRV